jgi:hypothetical protein
MCIECAIAVPLEGRKCAFKYGYFNTSNWACGTMLKLREFAEKYYSGNVVTIDDEHATLIPIEIHLDDTRYTHLLLKWYNSRGRVIDCRMLCCEGQALYPTESELLEIMEV